MRLMSPGRQAPSVLWLVIVASCFVVWPPCAGAFAGSLGANKFDLLLQYVLPGPDRENVAGYRHIRQAMAQKAIADAGDAGLRFLRVAAAGFFPADFDDRRNDLLLWQTN